jgi:hypothetical protein
VFRAAITIKLLHQKTRFTRQALGKRGMQLLIGSNNPEHGALAYGYKTRVMITAGMGLA